MMDKELLTVEQLAERIHVRPRTVKAWLKSGRIPVVRVSAKVIRFSWSAVLATLQSKQEAKGGDA